MIDANELRIGNWFLLGKYSQVYQILYKRGTGHSINHEDYKEEYLEPIPLTPEILIACGFKKANEAEWQIEYENDYWLVVKQLLKMEVYLGFDVEVYFEIELEHIKYLHQLQNLYYALTNKELEINL